MTRKDYEAIAAVLASTRPEPPVGLDAYDLWLDVRNGIADACAEDNPRFNRTTFFIACDQ